MKKNDVAVGTVSSIGCNYEGIIKTDGTVCFVPFSLVGEKVEYKVLKVNKNIAYAKLNEVLTPADERVRPVCKYFKKCGGCKLQHVKYREQLKLKAAQVKDCFRKIAGMTVDVLPAQKSINEYNYRNKLQLPVRNVDGVTKIGFFAENSHRLIEVDGCAIQQEWAGKIISVFKDFIAKYKIQGYSEERGDGTLRHIVVRNVQNTLLIVAVVNGADLPYSRELIDLLRLNFKKFSFFLSTNTSDGNVVMGDGVRLLYGVDKVTSEESGVKYSIGPLSFMQVNDSVKSKLYQDVVKSLNLTENSVVIDAFSGAGLLTAIIAQTAKKAIGIEIVKEAVESADELKKLNGLSEKMENVLGACEDVLPEIISRNGLTGGDFSLVLDPPRKGVDPKVLFSVLSALPQTIVYVSCSPQTLARDVGILTGALYYDGAELKKAENYTPKYTIAKIQPYDMFPQTKHVETLCVLTKI